MLKYLSDNFKLTVKLSKWIVDFYYSDSKLEKALIKQDLEIVKILISLVRNKNVLNKYLLIDNIDLTNLLLKNGAEIYFNYKNNVLTSYSIVNDQSNLVELLL